MTEDTSGARLYVYVKDWDKYRPRKDRPNYDWLQLHTSLLGNDAWLELSCPDRCLLITIWMLAQRYGNGRLKADERWLKSQAKAHKSSLQRLVDAGWVTLATTKAPPAGRSAVGLEEKRRDKEEERSANGAVAPADFLEDLRQGKIEITDLTDKQRRHMMKIHAARERGDLELLHKLGADQ